MNSRVEALELCLLRHSIAGVTGENAAKRMCPAFRPQNRRAYIQTGLNTAQPGAVQISVLYKDSEIRYRYQDDDH